MEEKREAGEIGKGEFLSQNDYNQIFKEIEKYGAIVENDEQVLHDFLTQFYDSAAHVPKEVLLQSEVDEARIIEQWLRQKRGTKVQLQIPKRGQKKDLVEMAATNAVDTLATLRQQWASDRSKHTTAMNELKESLDLPAQPTRIECYDIAHTQGKHTVGSMVVFVQGAPRKSDYRKFNVQTVGNDDYGAMKEVLSRRFSKYKEAQGGELHDAKAIVTKKKDLAWSLLPDLLLIDGGKGQLRMAREVLAEFELEDDVPVAALAKREEEVFVPNKLQSVLLPRRSQGLYLVQRVRDEAHRFANSSHRKQRAKAGTASILDSIPGIGPKRRKLLLDRFDGLGGLRSATVEEIASVPGIPVDVAESLKSHLD
ncbi:MAG: helix-hairpin-helix domain-containing protein [Candidatus Promineifilaceae bacterium]